MQVDRASRIRKMAKRISADVVPAGREPIPLLRALNSFSDSTLGLIEDALVAESEAPNSNYMLLYSRLSNRDEAYIREMLFYRNHYKVEASNSEKDEAVRGLRHLEKFNGQQKLDELTGTDLEIAVAFLNVTPVLNQYVGGVHVISELVVTAAGGSQYESLMFISDKQLQEVIVEHYQQADEIISYIMDRKTADPNALREYLHNDTALQTGVL